jgi:uncharacterized GH25 family protein
MTIEFGIRVTDENGNPVQGAKVSVHYPWAMDTGVSDEDGWARFEKYQAFGDAVLTSIYVNGEIRAHNIWIENGNTLFYSVEASAIQGDDR